MTAATINKKEESYVLNDKDTIFIGLHKRFGTSVVVYGLVSYTDKKKVKLLTKMQSLSYSLRPKI